MLAWGVGDVDGAAGDAAGGGVEGGVGVGCLTSGAEMSAREIIGKIQNEWMAEEEMHIQHVPVR